MAEKYALATIDSGGYIKTTGVANRIVHRESLIDDLACYTFTCFDTAKAARYGDQMILGVDKTDHACEVWVTPDNAEYVKDKLRIWAGCYGAWPVRQLNGEARITREDT